MVAVCRRWESGAASHPWKSWPSLRSQVATTAIERCGNAMFTGRPPVAIVAIAAIPGGGLGVADCYIARLVDDAAMSTGDVGICRRYDPIPVQSVHPA